MRLLAWIVILAAVAVLAGAFLAPPLFNLLLSIGRNHPRLDALRDVEFSEVLSRTVLVLALVLVPLALKLGGLKGWRGLGFEPRPGWWKAGLAGLLAGCATMALLFGLGWAAHAYVASPAARGPLAGTLLTYLAGALVVGVIEETLFRGVLFGVLARGMGFWGAAALSSLVFSTVHFARPALGADAVYGHWYAGLEFLGGMFRGAVWMPTALTLFAMGFLLCAFYWKSGSLYFVIGLHAGWVWIIRLGQLLLEGSGEPSAFGFLFDRYVNVPKSYATLIFSLLFLLVPVLLPGRPLSGGAAAPEKS